MKKVITAFVLIVSFAVLFSFTSSAKSHLTPQGSFQVKSAAFNANGKIPVKYVCTDIAGGQNISVPLKWSGAPLDTLSYAIFMYDLNPVAKNYVHWAVINIPGNITFIDEGASRSTAMAKGSLELPNTSGTFGYAGPCPPAGTGSHQYKIIVYALNSKTVNFSGRTTLAQFQAAVDGNVLAQAEISGYFERK